VACASEAGRPNYFDAIHPLSLGKSRHSGSQHNYFTTGSCLFFSQDTGGCSTTATNWRVFMTNNQYSLIRMLHAASRSGNFALLEDLYHEYSLLTLTCARSGHSMNLALGWRFPLACPRSDQEAKPVAF
jgi:hypothetical protein